MACRAVDPVCWLTGDGMHTGDSSNDVLRG